MYRYSPPDIPLHVSDIWNQIDKKQFPFSNLTPSRQTLWAYDSEKEKYKDDISKGITPPYSETDIWYNYNKWGFRCIEFDEIPDNALRVLSLGCSNIEGVGVPSEHTLPSVLTEMIQKKSDKPVVNLNLGVGGSSNRFISIRGVHAIETLKPDYIFVSWTYASRTLGVYEDGKAQDWISAELSDIKSTDPKVKQKLSYFMNIQNMYHDLNNLMVDINLLNYAAKSNNVVICNNMSILCHFSEIFDWLKVRIDNKTMAYYPEPIECKARDLCHPGYNDNKKTANELFKWYLNNMKN